MSKAWPARSPPSPAGTREDQRGRAVGAGRGRGAANPSLELRAVPQPARLGLRPGRARCRISPFRPSGCKCLVLAAATQRCELPAPPACRVRPHRHRPLWRVLGYQRARPDSSALLNGAVMFVERYQISRLRQHTPPTVWTSSSEIEIVTTKV